MNELKQLVFDTEQWNALESDDAKVQFLLTICDDYVSLYSADAQLSGRCDITAEDKDVVKQLAGELSLVLNTLEDIPSLLIVCKTVQLIGMHMGDLENPEMYKHFLDKVIENMNNFPDSIFDHTVHTMFNSQSFCHYFLESGAFKQIFENDIADGTERAISLVPLFLTETLLVNLADQPPERLIDVFETVMAADVDKERSMNFVDLLVRILKSCSRLNNKFLVSVTKQNLFEKLNTFLKQFSGTQITYLYDLLIISTSQGESTANYSVIRKLRDLYLSDISSEQRVDILHTILEKKQVYLANLDAFLPEKWFIAEVCSDIALFVEYTELLEYCATQSAELVKKSLTQIFPYLKVPVQPSVLYNNVFEFFRETLMMMLKLSYDAFNGDYFLDLLFIKPSLDDVLKLLRLYGNTFLPPFALLYGGAPYHSMGLVSRMVEIVLKGSDQDREMCLGLLHDRFTSGVLAYFLSELENTEVFGILKQVVPNKLNVEHMFIQMKGFDIIEANLHKNGYPERLIEFIVIVGNQNNIFDDWIVEQDSDCPIFSADRTIISKYLIKDEQILIPSLFPICPFPVTEESEYNFYLMGKYSLPVYRKLGYGLAKIPFLSEIAGRFIPPSFFIYCCFDNPLVAQTMLIPPANPGSLFEFGPTGNDYFELPGQIASLAFNIKITANSPSGFPFLTVNDITFSIRGSELFDASSNKIADITIGTWNLIFISNMRGPIPQKNFGVFVNGKSATLIKGSIGSVKIGSDTQSPHILYYVSSKIAISNTILALDQVTKASNLRDLSNMQLDLISGSFRWCPYYSTMKIVEDVLLFCDLFDRWDMCSHDKRLEVLPVIGQLPCLLRTKALNEKFFDRFMYSIEREEVVYIEYLECYLKAVRQVIETTWRTDAIAKLLLNGKLFAKMDMTQFSDFLLLCVLKELHSMELEWSILVERRITLFYFEMMYYFNNEGTSDSIVVFLSFLGEHMDGNKHLSEAAQIASIANMWNYAVDVVNFTGVKHIMKKFLVPHMCQTKMIELVSGLEYSCNKIIFSAEDLVMFSMMPGNAAKNIFLKFIDRYKESSLVLDHMPLICRLVQKFTAEREVFEYVMSLITNQRFSFGGNNSQLVIRRPIYLPLLLSLLVSVGRLTECDYSHKVYRYSLMLLKEQSALLLENPMIPYLHEFLNGGVTPTSLGFVPTVPELISFASFTKAEQKILIDQLNNSLQEIFPIAEKVQGDCVLGDPMPEVFTGFVNEVVLQVVASCASQPAKIKKILEILCISGRSSLVIRTICYIYNYELLTGQSLKVLEKITRFVCNKYPEMIGIIFDNMLLFCRTPERTTELLAFFVQNLRSVGPERVNKFLNVVSQQYVVLANNGKLAAVILAHVIENSLQIPSDFLTNLMNTVRSYPSDIVTPGTEDIATWTVNTELRDEFFASEGRIWSQRFEEITNEVVLPTKHYESIVSSLFTFASKYVVRCIIWMRICYNQTNSYMRSCEKRNAWVLHFNSLMSSLYDKELVNSYRITSFAGPDECNMVLLPSKFVITPPSSEKHKQDVNGEFLNMAPEHVIGKCHPVNDTPHLFTYSSVFQSYMSKLAMFIETFPDAVEARENCLLVRRDVKVPCVIFKCGSLWRILTHAKISDDGSLDLKPVDMCYGSDASLKEGMLMGEYGVFSMFCGHFVIVVDEANVYYSRKYVYAAKPHSLEIFSHKNGSFILQFDKQTNIFPVLQKYEKRLDQVEENWVNRKISNLDYLMFLNSRANRSTNDLCAYPVVPRLVFDFSGPDAKRKRDLSKPIDIVGDTDPEHTIMARRFSVQHFHHSENISQPLYVSTCLSRLAPYCRFAWSVNNGWDAGSRDFSAVEGTMFIGANTLYEFPPEFYCLPECMINVNKFIMPNGNPFDLKLPSWCPDVFMLLEFHRKQLESEETRANLHRWIDLVFGVARSGKEGEEAFNIFSPLSYYDPSSSDPQAQTQWMQTCGQVPFGVFTTRHPVSKPQDLCDIINHIKMNVQPTVSSGLHLHWCRYDQSVSIVSGDVQMICKCPLFGYTKHTHISDDEQFIAVTSYLDNVTVLRIDRTKNKIVRHASIVCEHPQFSVLMSDQKLCFTVCRKYIVIWSFVNSAIINKIEIPNTVSLDICRARSCVFIAAGTTIYQYSLNGFFIRKYTVSERVTVVKSFGFSFLENGIAFVLGTITGRVTIVAIDQKMHRFVAMRDEKVSYYPIKRIEIRIDNNFINVIDH